MTGGSGYGYYKFEDPVDVDVSKKKNYKTYFEKSILPYGQSTEIYYL